MMIHTAYHCIRARAHRWKARDCPTKFRLNDILVCLRLSEGDDIDIDEVECILSSLIFKKYIHGYLSHNLGVMVLSKVNPFPAITNQFDPNKK